MPHIVTLARPLPMPPLEAAGEPVAFHPVASTAACPPGTRVHCVTALDRLDAAEIAALPESVGLIASIGVGTDHIDLAAARARSILVSNTPVVTEDTADLAFGLILAACRRIGAGERFLRGGSWTADTAQPPLGSRVHGARLGLVGFGAIAQAVARRARGFGMEVAYWNRTERAEAAEALGARFEPDLDALLAGSGIVSLHTALTPDTRHILDARRLALMAPGAVLVNTGRGALVDEAALVAALKAGRPGAAGLDVFEAEPSVHPELLGMENVVLTPHIGSATAECRGDMARRAIGNILGFLAGGEVTDPVA